VATYAISAVHLVPAIAPLTHPHIGSVRLTTGQVLERSTVIAKIRAGERFVTNANPPGLVYVHPCPYCKAHDYITTHPDYTPTNNLLSLPKF
jgi:hypothetical protein